MAARTTTARATASRSRLEEIFGHLLLPELLLDEEDIVVCGLCGILLIQRTNALWSRNEMK
jgi:hypothetical protein